MGVGNAHDLSALVEQAGWGAPAVRLVDRRLFRKNFMLHTTMASFHIKLTLWSILGGGTKMLTIVPFRL